MGMSRMNCSDLLRTTALLLAPLSISPAFGQACASGSDSDASTLCALRARISGGVVISNGSPQVSTPAGTTTPTITSPQFSEASAYLAFETQPRLFSCCATTSTRSYKRLYVDPLLNVRLTTIGVNANAITKETPIAAPDASLIQSQKAAQVQFGALASINFGGFDIGNSRFHWGVGPAIKFSLQNVTDSQRATRIWNLRDDLYDVQEGAFRLALYRREEESSSDDDKKVWTPTAFVDIGWGRFQNFETVTGNTDAAKACLQTPAPCLSSPRPETEYTVTRPNRLHLEGRLYLGHIYVGLDINNGKGPDDMRFIGGVSIGLDRFFAPR